MPRPGWTKPQSPVTTKPIETAAMDEDDEVVAALTGFLVVQGLGLTIRDESDHKRVQEPSQDE